MQKTGEVATGLKLRHLFHLAGLDIDLPQLVPAQIGFVGLGRDDAVGRVPLGRKGMEFKHL